jgi:hypothetical protein
LYFNSNCPLQTLAINNWLAIIEILLGPIIVFSEVFVLMGRSVMSQSINNTLLQGSGPLNELLAKNGNITEL